MKLLICDIDGVMTDGTKTYNQDGEVISKSFHDYDWTAIKCFKAAGVNVVGLSSDSNINKAVFERRQIPFFLARDAENKIIDKARFLPMFETAFSITRLEMGYVGDDLFDINIMKEVGFKFCPGNANFKVREIAQCISCESGKGVLLYVLGYCIFRRLINEQKAFNLDKIIELDRYEK